MAKTLKAVRIHGKDVLEKFIGYSSPAAIRVVADETLGQY
jgi:hypothetical protein